jgi:hypothetical protein
MRSKLRDSLDVIALRGGALTWAVLVLAILCALVIGLRVPVQFPMPGYFEDIRAWAFIGRIDDTFTPLAYPLFAAPVYKLAGAAGIVALQGVLYVALVYVAIRLLERLQLPNVWVAAGALLILFHPELVTSISKVWDVDLSVFLLLLFVLLCLQLQARGPGIGITLAAGAVLGAAVFCRPNYALLLAVLLYAFGGTQASSGRRRPLMSVATAGITSAVVFALLGVASHGAPFVPRNGPYNLFAGNNPYTRRALLDRLNAEPSISEAFAAAYPPPLPDLSAPDAFYPESYQAFYTRQSIHFVRQHPVEELELVGVKLFTLFRPDTKVHPLRSAQGMAKLFLALPAVVFLLLLLLPGRALVGREDWLLLIVYGAYIVPFLVTNSDPRFRIPLDALLLLHCVRLAYLRWKGAGECTVAEDVLA